LSGLALGSDTLAIAGVFGRRSKVYFFHLGLLEYGVVVYADRVHLCWPLLGRYRRKATLEERFILSFGTREWLS